MIEKKQRQPNNSRNFKAIEISPVFASNIAQLFLIIR